jgi:multidrug efflux pump subunit AcrA (membrane-fusion protein)
MKKITHSFLSKPKIAVPASALVLFVAGFFAYQAVGTPPQVSLPQGDSQIRATSAGSKEGTLDLSFNKGGRVETVLVKEGDSVVAGQVLARISAPDIQGTISQTKGALDLAEAQYMALGGQFETAKRQQDTIVKNAYHALLSGGLEATPDEEDPNTPYITGSYSCDKEGSYVLKGYASGETSGYTIRYSGIESGTFPVTHETPASLGTCGLQVRFPDEFFSANTTWTIDIPNKASSSYVANKNAFDLAVANRDKVLSDLAVTIGTGPTGTSVAKAQVEAARGAYQAALGAYENYVITAPVAGTVSFVDEDLKAGQAAVPGAVVMSITTN